MRSEPSTPEMPKLHPRQVERWSNFEDGKLQDYKPHILVKEVKRSKGSGHRTLGLKTGRIHHLLSKIEYNYFLILDSSPVVLDIREQFPLNPQDTWKIACELGVPHHSHEGGLVVPTIDFMITVLEDGIQTLKARDIKPAGELSEKRTLEKLEIARTYCSARNIDYAICTDEDIPATLAKNLAELRSNVNLEEFDIPGQVISDVRQYLEDRLQLSDSLSELAIKCDKALGRQVGESLVIAQHLIMSRAWQFDLTQPFHPSSKGICKLITPIRYEAIRRHVA